MRTTQWMTVAFLLVIGVLIGSQNAVATTSTFGDSVPLGDGVVQSFVRVDDQGTPLSVGVAFTKDALSGLPDGELPFEVMVGLPEGVTVQPFDHITVDWNAHGHEPPGVYDVPHFDMHFYFMPVADREKIPPDAETEFANAPPEGAVPADYQAIPGGVPQMGAHWVDVTSPEMHGEPFTTTFIFGSYDGAVTFYEPMLAKAFLENTKTFTADIKQPTVFQKQGYYPTSYSVTYDEDTETYFVALEGLTYR
jgi:hypothetical protein